jgi:PhzF family phenazine biosynthesis protein
MPAIRFWQVDAFTDHAFGGNPAAVCWLERAASPDWMQAVASEMNLSETAFVRRLPDGHELRWFTPTVEVDLCGHATLATAHAIWSSGLAERAQPLRFHTRSGELTCVQRGSFIELDFPALPARPMADNPALRDALGIDRAVFLGRTKFDDLVVLDSADAVRRVTPDFAKLATIPTRGAIVTARSDDPRYDFQSRFFAPAVGVNEDPVCGSAHCCLAVYWAEQLGKQVLMAYQASARSGVLRLRANGDRVALGGHAVTVLQGELLA